MYIFKLFEKDETQPAIDARLLDTGVLRIGRDPQADWVMHDPVCEISRWHCEFEAGEDGLVLRCLGANGVFDADSNERLPQERDISVNLPQAISFGPYRMIADYATQGKAGLDDGQTLIVSPPLGASIVVPTQWQDAPPDNACARGGSLLDAFCEGAGLDTSALSSEDPEEVMRRAGAVYRQMVLGIGDLMEERERVRGQYQLARTTIGGSNNNPFKWAPTQRLAIDLLMINDRGFLSGPAALSASFRDIKKHLIATFEGLRASLLAAVQTFDPAEVETIATQRATLLKSKAATCWEIVCERQASLCEQANGRAEGPLNQDFVRAYEAAALKLEQQKL